MKKILILSAAALAMLPFLATAATLSQTLSTGTLYPAAGSTTAVSGTCGTPGANSTVSFTLTQNGATTALAATLNTDATGAFSGNVVFPTNFSAGAATLVASCARSGDTINSALLTFAAPASTAFGLPQASPTVGGLYNLTGACGNSGGTGTAVLTLTGSNGSSFTLGTVNLSSTGTFSDNVIIPATASTGQATFKATCSNSAVFSSVANIGAAAINAFAFSANPAPGASTMISGNCTNTNNNANAAVSFSVFNGGLATSLPATNALTNGSGTFNASVFFPASVGSNPTTLLVTCPNGSTFSNVIMLGAAGIVDPVDPVVPVGAVAAGAGPQTNANVPFGEALLITGMLGLAVLIGRQSHVQISARK